MEFFWVTACDAVDEGAYERRTAARKEHLNMLEQRKADGTVRFAAATLGEDGRLNGSMLVVACTNISEAERIVQQDPYVAHNVWREITIVPCRIAPMFNKKMFAAL